MKESPDAPPCTNDGPLWVIDGRRYGRGRDVARFDLQPEDIERIDVMKGDSAVARYGEEARDGVVIITTSGYRKP